ncbi:MAG: Tol-Pal system beta propeller repeat protein TolB [Mariprofundaceae bacterium]
MLKILLLIFLLIPSAAMAVEFDIYQSDYHPLNIAWLTASESQHQKSSNLLQKIVKNDLTSSQSFHALDPMSFLADITKTMQEVNYGDWRIIGTDILATCRLTKSKKTWKADVEVYDVFRSKKLSKVKLRGSDKSLRSLAHHVANHIYFTVTGIKGHFNSQVLYVRKRGNFSDLVYMDQDGANRQDVGRNFTLLLSPDWGPDNRSVAINTYIGNRPRLEILKLSTGKRNTFGAFKGLNSTPEFSPDGRYIAATLSHTGNAEIHLYDRSNHSWKRLTKNPGVDTSPSWSPDSKWVAFTSDRSGKPQIYRIRIDGGKPQRVSLKGAYNTSPAWSPRGDRIAFITLKDWEYALASMRIDGTDVRYLTTGGRIESPSWSPNAQMMLFSRENNSIRRIYRIPSWGGKAEAITPANEDASDPAWSR